MSHKWQMQVRRVPIRLKSKIPLRSQEPGARARSKKLGANIRNPEVSVLLTQSSGWEAGFERSAGRKSLKVSRTRTSLGEKYNRRNVVSLFALTALGLALLQSNSVAQEAADAEGMEAASKALCGGGGDR